MGPSFTQKAPYRLAPDLYPLRGRYWIAADSDALADSQGPHYIGMNYEFVGFADGFYSRWNWDEELGFVLRGFLFHRAGSADTGN